GRYLDVAEQAGFARDLCPYHTAMLGCIDAPERDAYVERLFTPPDLIIGSNMPCESESKSFLYAVQKYNVPHYFLDAPLDLGGFEPSQRVVDYYAAGLHGLLSFLGEHGLKGDEGKLSEVVARSRAMARLWADIDELRKLRPTPMRLADAVIAMYLPIYCAGHPDGLAALQTIHAEVEQRAAGGPGMGDDERFRLLLLGIPPYYNLGLLSYPEAKGGVFVKGEVEYVMTGQSDVNMLDPERPLQSLARKVITDLPAPTYAVRLEVLRRTIREFHIDGIVAARKRGCRNFPAGFRLVKDMAAGEFGVPTTVFDLDGLDLREYNDVQAKSNLDAFVEALASR
ncbi:MAG: 2-hydroxyacyl-CoA dehydratase, partial [Chloroflexi bacterium]|nr:2-hydroxyacyl-CoA dehydratase [Chloroflexota bacterium]